MLAAFLKAIGCIIPLMDAMYASYYTREVMIVLVREFQTPDEEMKKIVLKVSGQMKSHKGPCHEEPCLCTSTMHVPGGASLIGSMKQFHSRKQCLCFT